MEIKEKQLIELQFLLDRFFEDEATEEESLKIQEIVQRDPRIWQYYFSYIELKAGLHQLKSLDIEYNSSLSYFNDVLFELAEYEKIAPEVELPKEKPQRELMQKVVYPPREKRKVSKFNIIFLAINAAAILFFVLFLRFAPPKGGVEVATLTDSINAEWANVDISMQKGARLYNTKTPFMLRKGVVELTFDNNAQITIEGPAEFQILDDDMIKLNYGQLYSQVSAEAYGFQVCTQHAKVIDLGTEFGVKEGIDGDTEVHVLKGRVSLISGFLSNKINVDLLAGSARELNVETGELKEIPCKANLFARQIDSKTNIIWRGPKTLDLADIAGKGNGFGTGKASVIIHPTKGYTKDNELGFIKPRGFLPIMDNPFVDGIFVPNGDVNRIISTRGDIFKGAPQTSGVFSIDLVVNPAPGFFAVGIRSGTIEFNGQLYGSRGKPCINMHANIGLTFDLNAVRQNYHSDITRFTSRIGIADLNEPYPCNADFYVLVDGQIRYSLRQYKQKGVLNDVSVEIKDSDRFLTLVTTDGGDPDDPKDCYTRANSCDYCVFTEPILVLK